MLIYRFDNAESYRIFEGATSVVKPVMLRVETDRGEAVLRIVARRRADGAAGRVVLALPLRAIGGIGPNASVSCLKTVQFQLEACRGDGGGPVRLEASDAGGGEVVCVFEPARFVGWCRLTADITRPDQSAASRRLGDVAGITFPLQLERLTFDLVPSQEVMDLRLKALAVTGDVRLVAVGIA